MKVACIGDIHGTTKFLDCYEQLKAMEDLDKIIVFGDHFDPYKEIPIETMLERYNQFINCCKEDDRIVSLLGNHDLEGYVISGCTNRTAWDKEVRRLISEAIKENLPNSYLIYKINNWLFSHAGVSQTWLNMNADYKDDLLSNKKGWTINDLQQLCSFYRYDWSNYGDDKHQGCTWIRPKSLIKDLPENYNQVIAHTQVYNISNIKDEYSLEVDVWMIDNQQKSEYLLLNI